MWHNLVNLDHKYRNIFFTNGLTIKKTSDKIGIDSSIFESMVPLTILVSFIEVLN